MTDPRSAAADAVSTVLNAMSRPPHRLVVDSPPGAGKTTLVVQAARHLGAEGERFIIVAQTNQQVDDIVRRLSADTELTIGRLTGSKYLNEEFPEDLKTLPRTQIALTIQALTGNTHNSPNPKGCQAIVATAAKWAKIEGHHWRWAIIDEAYQMRSDALLLIGNLFDRALFVGDPGQLDPFTTIETERHVGLPYDPSNSAVAVLLASNPDIPVYGLPISWRLPPSAATIISNVFYPTTPFTAGTSPDQRRMTLTAAGMGTPVDRTLQMAAHSGWALHELPARDTLPTDYQSIRATADIALRLLELGTTIACERTRGEPAPLQPRDIAIGTIHRGQALQVRQILDRDPRGRAITTDTANRLQGREFAVTVVLHPLSGRRDASAFHLEAGRLCVLTSRHRHACIVVARAGIDDVLDAHPGIAPVHLNTDPKFPDGWTCHRELLKHLKEFRVAA